LIAALESMRNVDLGGFPITFTRNDHSGSTFIELTVIVGAGNFPFLPLPASVSPAKPANTAAAR